MKHIFVVFFTYVSMTCMFVFVSSTRIYAITCECTFISANQPQNDQSTNVGSITLNDAVTTVADCPDLFIKEQARMFVPIREGSDVTCTDVTPQSTDGASQKNPSVTPAQATVRKETELLECDPLQGYNPNNNLTPTPVIPYGELGQKCKNNNIDSLQKTILYYTNTHPTECDENGEPVYEICPFIDVPLLSSLCVPDPAGTTINGVKKIADISGLTDMLKNGLCSAGTPSITGLDGQPDFSRIDKCFCMDPNDPVFNVEREIELFGETDRLTAGRHTGAAGVAANQNLPIQVVQSSILPLCHRYIGRVPADTFEKLEIQKNNRKASGNDSLIADIWDDMWSRGVTAISPNTFIFNANPAAGITSVATTLFMAAIKKSLPNSSGAIDGVGNVLTYPSGIHKVTINGTPYPLPGPADITGTQKLIAYIAAGQDARLQAYKKCLTTAADATPKYPSAIGDIPVDNIGAFIGFIITQFLLGLGGLYCLGITISSAIRLQTSGGSPDTIKKAREQLTQGFTGLLLIIFGIFLLRIIVVYILKIPGFV